MMYTLWRGQELLGESELETPTAAGRAGVFRPAPAFEAVRAVFELWQSLAKESAALVETRPRDLPPGEAMRRALGETGLGAEIAARHDALRSLGLGLRDAEGAAVPAAELLVWEMEIPPVPPDLTEEQLAEARSDFAAAGMELGGRNYMLLLLREGRGPAGNRCGR